MKTALHTISLRATLKILITSLIIANSNVSSSQCIAGSNTANLNWDNLDYLITTGSYATYVTAAMSQTQAFTIGVNRVVINYPATITTTGENVTHTGEAGSFGTGADVQYTGNGNITLTFDQDVNNLQFSLYDIDNNQRVNVTALNGVAVPLLITMTRPAGGNVVITGSGTINAQGQAPNTAQANTSTIATLNIAIIGPVRTVTIALSNTGGDFWLSDLTACVTGSFPIDYFVGMRPFTGQPTYVVGTSDINSVSTINVATGEAKMIFEDPASPMYINGLGYDHLQHDLYYVIDFTSNPAINKTIKRYSVDNETISILVPNVNTLGIPTYQRGVESAGCAFYDGDLYFGVEGNLTPGNNGGRETIIWRIEFDAPGGNAIKAAQVYATPSDNGAGTSLHDWNDFTIADGILVDFAGSPNAAARRFTHYNLQTQQITNNYYTGGLTPRQAGITWDDTRYWIYNQIAVYNENGTIGPVTNIFGATALDWTGFCGDATGFRPKSDFGDAPATYDPVALSPALHEKDTALHLGPTWDQEFDKISSVNADADGSDEDCIMTLNVLDTALTTYLANITVYNNTGANSTVIGWLDINGNGTFEASEGRSITVPNGGPVLQNRTLSWVNINTPLVPGQTTYLRIRITRAASAMTTNNATGYYNNGEVEDYRVFITTLLPVNMLSFTATKQKEEAVKVEWSTDNEVDIANYEVQRSTDANNWQTIGVVAANNIPGIQRYVFMDNTPLPGKSYYRLKIMNKWGSVDKYSMIRVINMGIDNVYTININPNPVKDVLMITLSVNESFDATLKVYDTKGRLMLQSKETFTSGMNKISYSEAKKWAPGTYFLTIDDQNKAITSKFIVIK